MNSDTSIELTVDVVGEAFRKLVALNQNDIDATLQHLKVPSTERSRAKTKLEGLLSGNSEIISELEADLSSGEEGAAAILTTVKGGKTKYRVLKQWSIPYGEQLYVSHEVVDKALDIGALITAITAACGPEEAPLAAGLAIGLAALKLLDRGNGIIITRVPIFIGPCVPTPQ